MSPLVAAFDDYLGLRRSLGYKLERAGELLADFVAGLDRAGVEHLTVEAAVAWALQAEDTESAWRAQRLGVVRGFARYLHAIDPTHQIPPTGLLPRGRRPAPFLYDAADIAALMAAARLLRSPLRAATMETLIGLAAVTGLRVSELLRLDRADVSVDIDVLAVRNTKLGRSRHVPLHPSATAALAAYLRRREQLFPRPAGDALFISTTGTRLRPGNLWAGFVEVVELAGLPPRRGRQRPRVGDLRHSFAVQTLLDWHTAEVDVGPLLPVLSTYLGHVSPASTYWYLSAAPPLLAAAARRLHHPAPGTP